MRTLKISALLALMLASLAACTSTFAAAPVQSSPAQSYHDYLEHLRLNPDVR